MKNFDELVKKVKEMSVNGEVDLSRDEDLSLAVMNLISLEEHLFFSGEKTNKDQYFDLLKKVREQRKDLMKKLLPKTEGESWCISKHLLSASMRLIEVGTKMQEKDKEGAKEMFDRAYKLYSAFWALRLGVIDTGDVKSMTKDQPWTVEDIVNNLVDCCNE